LPLASHFQRNTTVKAGLAFVLVFVARGWSQSGEDQDLKKEPGPGHEIGSGAGNIGKGAAKGAGDLAKGTAKGAVSLATLHPIDAGVSLGKGVGAAGKDVALGTVKGTGKIGKGVGKAIKKIL
jgi:hypothetical protein